MSSNREKAETMKRLTFGVEVEMYGITRKDAACVVADHFHTVWSSDCSHDSCYDARKIVDPKGRAWTVERDSSILAPEPMKTEMATPPLEYGDIGELQEIIRELRHAGAKSDPAHECGVHIHIGSDQLTAAQIRNLCNIMASHEELLIHAVRIPASRTGQWCKTVDARFLDRLNQAKPKSRMELEDIWYNAQGGTYCKGGHYHPSRYHMLNLHGCFEDAYYNHTVEFRLFQFDNPDDESRGGLHAGKLKAYIQLCLAMVAAAQTARSASTNQPQMENEKYAMRTWLLRLGMIGEEFATARKWLTCRLDGDAAFRNGRSVA